MITASPENPGALKRFFQNIVDAYVRRPDALLLTVRKWWWEEAAKIYNSDGGRTGRRWQRLTPQWVRRKGNAEINVETGATKTALTGGIGSWYRVAGRNQQFVGIRTDAAQWATLNKWRPLTSTTRTQMRDLDAEEQRTIRQKIDPKLPVRS